MKLKIQDIKIGSGRRSTQPDKVRSLADSISQVGLINPITVTSDNTLVAGMHRLEAHKELGLFEIEVTVIEIDDSLRIRLAEIDENLVRNNGTELDRREWLAERKRIYEAMHPETRHGVAGGLARQNSATEIISFAKDTAQKTGMTDRSIRQKTRTPQVLPQAIRDDIRDTPIADSGVELDELTRVASEAPEKAKEAVQAVKDGEAKSIREAVDRMKRKEKREEIVTQIQGQETPQLDNTPSKFAVIYADPPWRYNFSKSDSRAIENQYPTMSIDEICKLPIKELATKDAILFMWTTTPKLQESFKVIEAWGFEYKTNMIWDKVHIGMGYYARGQHEILMVAKRGNIPAPEPSNRPPSIITEKRTKHSAKPDKFYEIIEAMYPEYNKIELFARRTRSGWFGWGNQYEQNS